MNGDPCICGATDTWHPECYQKQQQEANEAHIAAAVARGREQGMREAAEIAYGFPTSVSVYATSQEARTASALKRNIVESILAAIGVDPAPTCEWEPIGGGSYQYVIGCDGRTHCGPVDGRYCSKCGKTISIKGE